MQAKSAKDLPASISKVSRYVKITLVNLSSSKRCIDTNISLGSGGDFLFRSKLFLLNEFFAFSTVVAQVLPGAGEVQSSRGTSRDSWEWEMRLFPKNQLEKVRCAVSESLCDE